MQREQGGPDDVRRHQPRRAPPDRRRLGADRERGGLFDKGDIFLAKTVVLETEWVLRYAYGLAAEQVTAALRKLFGVPGVALEDAAAVSEALVRHEQGLDFADALHVASSRKTDRFVTIDRDLVKRAKKLHVDGVVGV